MAAKTEKDYIAIARQRVTRPSELESYRRFLIYAKNKKGKTRFGLSGGIPKTLVLDPEHGTDTMRALNPHVWHITKWEDLQEAWGALRTGQLSPHLLGKGPEKEPYLYLSVDGTTRMHNMSLHYVRGQEELKDLDRKPGMIQRPDYNKAGELTKQMMLNFMTLRMHVVYTAQERVIRVEDDNRGEDELSDEPAYFVADLPNGVRGTLNSIVDVIGRLYVERADVRLKDGTTEERMQRRLWIGLHEKYDTGFRSDYTLPDFIKQPTIPKLTALMLSGTERGN
jgi:hypothetical protein